MTSLTCSIETRSDGFQESRSRREKTFDGRHACKLLTSLMTRAKQDEVLTSFVLQQTTYKCEPGLSEFPPDKRAQAISIEDKSYPAFNLVTSWLYPHEDR